MGTYIIVYTKLRLYKFEHAIEDSITAMKLVPFLKKIKFYGFYKHTIEDFKSLQIPRLQTIDIKWRRKFF